MEPRISRFLVGQKTRLDCGLEDWVRHPGISSVLGAFREALIAVDRHSRSETQEFLPQKRSRLYGIAATLAQCPQGNRGSGGEVSNHSTGPIRLSHPIKCHQGGAWANPAPLWAAKLTSAFSPQSITTVPTTEAALTCACRDSEASPAAARTPPPLRVETETCEPDVIDLNNVRFSHVQTMN